MATTHLMTRLASAVAPPAEEPVDATGDPTLDWGSAPSDVLRSVFTVCVGDTPALSAIAGVSHHWRDTALQTPRLWRELRVSDNDYWRARLTGPRHIVYSCLDFIDDAVVLRLAARAGAELTVVSLPNASVTDACLALFAPAAAPQLKVLHLAGCEKITARGVASVLAGAELKSLSLEGTAPLRVTLRQLRTGRGGDADVLSKLFLLCPNIVRDDCSDCECGLVGLDVDSVCPHAMGVRCCGKLFNLLDNEALQCDFCMNGFCKDHSPRPCKECQRYVCSSCMPEIVDIHGGHCSICKTMLCGDCADEAGEITHFSCSVCDKQSCISCAWRGPPAGLMCMSMFRSYPSPGCLNFVCQDCAVPIVDGRELLPNIILCQMCHLPFCGPCVQAGRGVRATGRVNWEWLCPAQAFCTDCDKRKAKAKR
jgi:hypothetical protein